MENSREVHGPPEFVIISPVSLDPSITSQKKKALLGKKRILSLSNCWSTQSPFHCCLQLQNLYYENVSSFWI